MYGMLWMKMVTGVIAIVGARRWAISLLVAAIAGGGWAIQARTAAYLDAAASKPRCAAHLPMDLCSCPATSRCPVRAEASDRRAEASDRKAEGDYLFRNAPTEVSRMRRAEQIRRANKAPSLKEIPFKPSFRPSLAHIGIGIMSAAIIMGLMGLVFRRDWVVMAIGGIAAAVGWHILIVAVACAIAHGLYAGWLDPLIAADAPPAMWAARWVILWALLTAAFWPTAPSLCDRQCMSFFMAIASALICAAWLGLVLTAAKSAAMFSACGG